MPEAVKKVFEEKRGYANYYFNRLEQDRVLKQWKSPVDAKATSARRPGASSAGLPSGKDVEFRISDKDAAMKAPAGDQQWSLRPKFADAVASARRHPAVAVPLSLLAVEGPKGFNDMSYLGTFPLPGGGDPLRVRTAWSLVTCWPQYRGIEAWFYFDARGELAAMEVYPEEHEDPLEFHFSDYRRGGGRDLPGRLKIVSGGNVFETFDLDKFGFSEAGK